MLYDESMYLCALFVKSQTLKLAVNSNLELFDKKKRMVSDKYNNLDHLWFRFAF